MVDFSALSALGVVLAFDLDEDLIVYYPLQTPQSTPREVADYALIATIGVVYLLV